MSWLGNFPEAHRDTAAALLDELLLVGAKEFVQSMMQQFEKIRTDNLTDRPIAFYAEREVEKDKAGIIPIFGSATGRSVGKGPQPVPFDPIKPEVGSEGIVANLVTSFCRRHESVALNHPGPDLLREHRVGPVIIATDFIGSGQRIWKMLEAFRAVATIRSWKSYRYLKFYVVAYSGTEAGLRKVKSSRLSPQVLTVVGCPTLNETFRQPTLDVVKTLCRTYPRGHQQPFGYDWTGALIAFEHGIPNNAPPILHSTARKWTPLFRKRSTIDAESVFPSSNRQEIASRAEKLLKIRDAETYLSDFRGSKWIETMLVLAAIERGARTYAQVSAASRIDIENVRDTLVFTEIALWTTDKLRLTRLGRSELQRLRKRRARRPLLPNDDKPYYYPTQLRAR